MSAASASDAARSPRVPRSSARAQPGVTLFEVLIASAILAMMSLMIFAAFDHTSKSRTRLGDRQQRDHVARVALARLSRDLRSAFLSAHVSLNPSLTAVVTAFVGRDQNPGDRLDLTTFSHRRFTRGAHEGDACEVGYRVESRRSGSGYDLVRRESPRIDMDPLHGGTVDVLVPDVETFNLRFYDQATDRWLDSWDTTNATGQAGRLPPRVRIELSVREADGKTRSYRTEVSPMIPDVLRFGLPVDFR